MKDYKTIFDETRSLREKPRHINAYPRSDLQKVFVFTEDVPNEALRTNLEERIGVSPDIDESAVFHSILYVIPIDIPERILPEELEKELRKCNADSTAVFIRGATNPFTMNSAQNKAGKLLCLALEYLQKEYWKDKILWRFKEAKTSLDTFEILESYDKKLALKEFPLG